MQVIDEKQVANPDGNKNLGVAVAAWLAVVGSLLSVVGAFDFVIGAGMAEGNLFTSSDGFSFVLPLLVTFVLIIVAIASLHYGFRQKISWVIIPAALAIILNGLPFLLDLVLTYANVTQH